MPPALIIFDCDGVLVDSEPLANRVLAEALADLGLHLTLEETMQQFVGRSVSACEAHIAALTGRPVPAGFTPDWQARTLAAFRAGLEPVPGVRAALDALPYPRCVASSSNPERIALALSLTGLTDYFDGRLFSATQVARSKPAPDLFLFAAHTLGAAPERCVVVEDSRFGAQAGVAAGMRVLGYAPHDSGAALAEAGAVVFADMAELPRLVAGT
ncbi:MAG: HAD family hydrolase [Anaerolineales bacterium]|nr:HAD family hydrolase [Anaerolineales bacterium]